MKYFDFTLPSPAENLACDEAILDRCDESPAAEVLRFWEPATPFVVLGYANRAATEVNLPECEIRGIPVLRRCSGGGAVLQGPGCLNYSLILRINDSGPLHTISAANQFILEKHQAALQPLVPANIEIRGITDLALGPLKFSGNAQRRKRNALIFHGTFLLGMDLALIETVLRKPSKEPDYRHGRRHTDFLKNLNLSPTLLKDALRKAWSALDSLEDAPNEKIAQLAQTKYDAPAWNLKF
jgi:lipoate-protein ligase A